MSSTATDLDAFFGQHLLMGVFPMAPMPLNDHSIQPGNDTIDGFYQDHAALFGAMRACAVGRSVGHGWAMGGPWVGHGRNGKDVVPRWPTVRVD